MTEKACPIAEPHSAHSYYAHERDLHPAQCPGVVQQVIINYVIQGRAAVAKQGPWQNLDVGTAPDLKAAQKAYDFWCGSHAAVEGRIRVRLVRRTAVIKDEELEST